MGQSVESPPSPAPMASTVARVRQEGALALAIGSALIGCAVARFVFPDAPSSAGVFSLLLALLGFTAGRSGMSNARDAGIEWLAVLGMVVSVPAAVALAVPAGVCLALFLAPPAGLALAALWWSLLGSLRTLESLPTMEDGDVAALVCGRWLMLLGGFAAPIAIVAADPPLSGAAVAVALFGAVRASTGLRGRRRVREWLTNVADGAIAGVSLVPASTFDAARIANLPRLARSRDPLDGVVVRTTAAGPFRDAGIAWARAPLAPRAPLPSAVVPWRAVRGALAVLGALFAPLATLMVSAAAAEMLTSGGQRLAPADLICGWLLLLSGPATGAALLVLSYLHRPTRATVWWLGIAIYLLACPFVCTLLSFAAAVSAH